MFHLNDALFLTLLKYHTVANNIIETVDRLLTISIYIFLHQVTGLSHSYFKGMRFGLVNYPQIYNFHR